MATLLASHRLTSAAIVMACSVFAFGVGTKMMIAQTQPLVPILVTCTSEGAVSAKTLEQLCESLHDALIAKYPAANFVLADGTPDQTASLVTLETFVANKTTIEASLNWQLLGDAPVTGARMGFSISDKDITPEMQRKFLTRLVNDTPLPL
jgi:hypothetical protein